VRIDDVLHAAFGLSAQSQGDAGLMLEKDPVMNSAKLQRGPVDATQVNVLEAQDLKYWSRALGVSVERLIMAVAQVGAMADDVRAELRRQRR